jgi:hypothetical protein
MRLWAILAAGLATAAAFAACASSQTAPGVADAGDGSNQAIGTTCNPSLKEPCAQPSDVCSVAVCDPTTLLCTRVPVDAGPTCSNGSPPDAGPSCAGECDASEDAEDAAPLDATSDALAKGDGGDSSVDATSDAGDAEAD